MKCRWETRRQIAWTGRTHAGTAGPVFQNGTLPCVEHVCSHFWGLSNSRWTRMLNQVYLAAESS